MSNQLGTNIISKHTYSLDAVGNRTETLEQQPQLPGSTPPTIDASDSFGRTASNSWGSADIGGAYSVAPPTTDYAVNGSAGTITSQAAGDNLRAVLSSVSARDVSVVVRISADKAPTADQFAYVDFRRVDANNYYQIQVRMATDGHAYIKLRRIVANVTTDLGVEQQVAGYTTGANAPIWLRAQATGASPTTLASKAWPFGQSEPAGWQLSASDATAALQVAAPVGVRTFIPSATNFPITFSFDNFSMTAPSPLVAADRFTRTLSGSWGSADTGGTYSLAAPTSDYNVNGSAGTITSQAAGDLLRAVLSGIFVREVNVAVRLWSDKTPTADQFAYVDVRRVDFNNYYQLQVRLATDGHAYVKLRRIVGNVTTDLGAEQQVAGFTTGPGVPLWLRVQATGVYPTTLSVKAWPNGQPERHRRRVARPAR